MLVDNWGNRDSLSTSPQCLKDLGNGLNKALQTSLFSSLLLLSDVSATQQPLVFELSVLERYYSCHPFLFVGNVSHGLVYVFTCCSEGGTVWGGYITYGMWDWAGRCRSAVGPLKLMPTSELSLALYLSTMMWKKNYTIGSYHQWQNFPAVTPFLPWWTVPSETVSPDTCPLSCFERCSVTWWAK